MSKSRIATHGVRKPRRIISSQPKAIEPKQRDLSSNSRMAIADQPALETSKNAPIPSTMLAAVYRGMNDIRLETVPVPEIGEGEILVRVHTCGVCGTDLKKIATGSHSAPRIFGHETSGTIAAVG